MKRRQFKAKGKNVGSYGYTGEEMAGKEKKSDKWGNELKRLGAGSMVLATRTLTSHPRTGKDQKGHRVGKGREHLGQWKSCPSMIIHLLYCNVNSIAREGI